MTDRDLLEVLVAKVEALQVSIDRLAPEPRISRKDRVLLATLLPLLLGVFTTTGFTAAEVLAAPRLKVMCPAMSSKRLGKFFARVAGVWINGLQVERFGEEGHVILWRVVSLRLWGVKDHVTAA